MLSERRKSSRRTPAKLRPHCYAVRKDLDPCKYATIEDLKRAIADGTFDRNAGACTQEEVLAMNKDLALCR